MLGTNSSVTKGLSTVLLGEDLPALDLGVGPGAVLVVLGLSPLAWSSDETLIQIATRFLAAGVTFLYSLNTNIMSSGDASRPPADLYKAIAA